MALEVIDLISDSEDDLSPTKAASSTLQAFGARKEKEASKKDRNLLATPAIAQRPTAQPQINDAHADNTPNFTNTEYQSLPPNASLAYLLRYGTPNGSVPRSTAPAAQQQSHTKPSPKTAKPRRTSGPLHEERLRRFEAFHNKEAERRGRGGKASLQRFGHEQGVDTQARVSGSPLSAIQHGVAHSNGVAEPQRVAGSQDIGAPVPLKRGPPSPVGGIPSPEAKRRKDFDDDGFDVTAGMQGARLLSAAAISPLIGNDSQQPLPRGSIEMNGLTEHAEPTRVSTWPSNSNNSSPNKPNIVRTEAEPVAAEGTYLHPVTFVDSKESSPDVIPAKPTRRPESTAPSSAFLPDLDQNMQDKESLPDEIPAMAPRKTVNTSTTLPEVTRIFRPPPTSYAPTPTSFSGRRKSGPGGNFGKPYTPEEDSYLITLKEESKVSWEAMPGYFSGRTQGSLQVRYSTIRHRKSTATKPKNHDSYGPSTTSHSIAVETEYTAPARRVPRTTSRNDGMVSWADIKKHKKLERITRASESAHTPVTEEPAPAQSPVGGLDTAYPSSINRILRCRELGSNGGRAWSSKARLEVSDELQNHVSDTLGPRRYFHGTPRDVTCLAWAPDGNRFAAGAIAMDDEASMQYNGPNNLLLGDVEQNSLVELPEHHVPRPIITNSQNVNSLHAMRETQDPRLFKTVAAVEFSGDGNTLLSAGSDGVVCMHDSNTAVCLSSHQQRAEVSLLAYNPGGVLASACHRSDDGSISILRCDQDVLSSVYNLGPSRTDVQSSLPIFPSALKWGSGAHSHLLLAGFANDDSFDEDRLTAGEIFLWDSTSGEKIDLPAVHNVFDLAWNPSPSSGSSLFAVAGSRPGKRLRSSIQCFAPNQGRASRVLQWDCPAADINDVIYCPHDDNLIAAGATDGKVYIWDKRFADRSQLPLHVLSHGQTKNVLDHNLDPEVADSGVRFLSWSATGNRLYSGSSDGTVKIWNPYCTTQNALVKDVATFNSAIISGAFSPDYRDLLIGEEQGQLNLLGIDREGRSVRAAKKFDLYPAPVPKKAEADDKFAPARELLDSGEIKIKPMGILPKKQAVQGPNYRGPFIKPPIDYIPRLMMESNEIVARLSAGRNENQQGEEWEKALKSAKQRRKQIDIDIQKALASNLDHELLEPHALENQKRLREIRHARKKDPLSAAMKRCKLDCNYLPTAGDDDGEAPDNQRSQQRIPGSLLFQKPPLDISDMTNAEIQESGLKSKCSSCMGPAAKPKRGRLPKCEKCILLHTGLTARCESCAVPIRPNLDSQLTSKNVCERCEFHCLRCGQLASVSPAGDVVECLPCGAVWEVGVLGYELKSLAKRPKWFDGESREPVMESLDQRVGRLFGEAERERLAGGWRVGLVDG